MHVAEGCRNAAVTHDYCNLMETLRQYGPEIPIVLGRAAAGAGVTLDGAVKVGKIMYIADKEGWSIVADQVPVAFLSVEFDGSAPDIALTVGSAALPGNGGETDE